MDNNTAIIDRKVYRKVWNFIKGASKQACAEYGVDEKEVWSDNERFGYLKEFADGLIQEVIGWGRSYESVRFSAINYVRAVIMQFAA